MFTNEELGIDCATCKPVTTQGFPVVASLPHPRHTPGSGPQPSIGAVPRSTPAPLSGGGRVIAPFPTKVRLGNAIRNRYRAAGFSQLDLADELDRSQSTVSDWVCGKTCPSAIEVIELDQILGLQPGTLLADAGLIDRPVPHDCVQNAINHGRLRPCGWRKGTYDGPPLPPPDSEGWEPMFRVADG